MSAPLVVIFDERISGWIDKGEVIDRYLNPGDLFDEIHVLLLNDDRPDPVALARLGGRATVTVHNVAPPDHLFRRTLGWRPRLLTRHLRPAVTLAERLSPALVRCHGAGLNVIAARAIRRATGAPYVVSLHINPDEDIRGRFEGIVTRTRSRLARTVERTGLRDADLVLPVYESIVPYLESLGVRHYEVAYNVLNPVGITPKASYALGAPARIISVGRQIEEKNPENVIRAVAERTNLHLTLVGDGPLHQRLAGLVDDLGVEDRITLRRRVPNGELCAMLPGFDIFATHSDYWELSKAVLEAFLTGLPIVVNHRPGLPVPELNDDLCVRVADSPEGYGTALDHLLSDTAAREALGTRARAHAEEHWSPVRTEARFAEIYRRLLASSP